MSEPLQPIVYYLDRGAPEPIRSALLEGARWWNQAFEAAGYKNAFRVELMPEGADLMDLRYNVIQWVHRATRGRSEEHTSELQSRLHLVCRLLLEKKKQKSRTANNTQTT